MVDESAPWCGADPDALDRVLGLLASHGIFRHDRRGYAHTPASCVLRSDDPTSIRALVRMLVLPVFLAAFSDLERSVRTGAPAVEVIEPNGFFAYLRDHPDEAGIYARAISAKAAPDIAAVLGAYDFSRFAMIADIGGGRGHLLRAVLDAVPGSRGVLFDLPAVIDPLDVEPDRLASHAGDFFVHALPSADAYILMEVLHDWNDDQCVAILAAIHRAAAAGASVLVIEHVRGEPEDPRGRILDVIMLVLTGGRERTAEELSALFSRAGFSHGRVIDTAGPLRIVEAKAI
jgi:hypothetical protein